MDEQKGTKRRVEVAEPLDKELLEITPLGSGNEVGRSCHIIKFKGKTIMLDCGIHPAYTGVDSLPFFTEVEPSEIDLLLISHFHLDHAAALPYFLKEHSDFKGRIFMTSPTKSIYKLILQDFVKVSSIAEETLYDEQTLLRSMERIEVMKFHEVQHHNGIKFWCYNAGHVLGAAMFMIEIAGVRLLYTGDYSRRQDRHLMAAELPPPEYRPDILVIESTYGVQTLQPVVNREKRFTEFVATVVKRGGRCLIPVFALGRAQELLLILDEHWEQNKSLQGIPIYYASLLARKCMNVYRTYVDCMNEEIQTQAQVANPFFFKHIINLKGSESLDDSGPCVVMASPGMLQNGLSRELFEKWCPDKRNGCIIPGYCVEGTLAKHILSAPSTITDMKGTRLPLAMSVLYVSFSAHADYSETSQFVDALRPPHVILVHGDEKEMGRLKVALQKKFAGTMQISTPRNCQTVKLPFKAQKMAKTVGLLAVAPENRQRLSGLIIQKNFNYHIMAASDLATYTPLSSTTVEQQITVPFHQSFDCLRFFVRQMYVLEEDESPPPVKKEEEPSNEGGVKAEPKEEVEERHVFMVHGAVRVTKQAANSILLEWKSNPANDMIADSLVALMMNVESNPGAVKAIGITSCGTPSVTLGGRQLDVEWFLKQQFGRTEKIPGRAGSLGTLKLTCNQVADKDKVLTCVTINAYVDLDHMKVRCEDPVVRSRIERTLERAVNALGAVKPSQPDVAIVAPPVEAAVVAEAPAALPELENFDADTVKPASPDSMRLETLI